MSQNNYFPISGTIDCNFCNINNDRVALFLFKKQVELDDEHIEKIDSYNFRDYLKRGFYSLIKYLLDSDYVHSSNFEIEKVVRNIVKYGSIELVDLLIERDMISLYRLHLLNQSFNENDLIDNETETLIYHLLNPELDLRDNSVFRYESIFYKLVEQLENYEFDQLGRDLTSRFSVILDNNLYNIFDFYIGNYSYLLAPDTWLENYISMIYNDNEYWINKLAPYVDKKLLKNYSEEIHNIHVTTYAKNPESMARFYREFKDYITSFEYFDIIVCDTPILNESNVSKNAEYLALVYPQLYNDNITVANLVKYYERYSDWDENLIPHLVTLKPDFTPIDDTHSLFNLLRTQNMERIHAEDVRDQLFSCEILNYLVENYPDHYKYISSNEIMDDSSADEHSDSDLNTSDDSGIYYLLIDEHPFIPINFPETLCDFMESHHIPCGQYIGECQICQDIINENETRSIRCCGKNNENGHIFCESCLRKWLTEERRTCPTCRAKLF
jgi:hypothetical protein